jgi:hypothetical protein
MALSLAACSVAGGVTVPEREVPISVETALEAQDLAMNGLMAGSVEWTEAQVSSLLTELLKANSGDNVPVENITAWFEPGQLYLRLQVKEGVLPAALGTTLDLAGSIDVQDGKLMVDLSQAAAGPYVVEGATLAPISAQVNSLIAGLVPGVPVTVEVGKGTLGVALAQ